jgi:hypothetical protein
VSPANYLGFDPGGAIGVALLTIGNTGSSCLTDCADSVDAVLDWASKTLDRQTPLCAGLDTFLYWETDDGGWRKADRWLRDKYPLVRKSILSSNSARGAMAVQGMALAIRLRERWPHIELVETHPKVVYYALANRKHSWPSGMAEWLIEEMDCRTAEFVNEHCWDAAISAWAAMKGHKHCWKRNLRELSNMVIEPAGGCAYWWPH